MASLSFMLRAAAVALACSSASGASADIVQLRADAWCPYNCTPGSDRPGYLIEIAREALALANHEVEYATMNWLRSIEAASAGEIDGVVGAVAAEVPDFHFSPKLGEVDGGFATLYDTVIGIDASGALVDVTIGVVRDYDYSTLINAYMEAYGGDRERVQFIQGEDALERNLLKLLSRRIDAAVDSVAVLENKLAELNLQDQVKLIPANEPEPIYIAFSPANPNSPTYAAALAEGMEILRENGRLAEILARYGISDWK